MIMIMIMTPRSVNTRYWFFRRKINPLLMLQCIFGMVKLVRVNVDEAPQTFVPPLLPPSPPTAFPSPFFPHNMFQTRLIDTRVLKTESFLELPWPFLLTLVSDGELQVDEADLFQAVNAWVSKDPADRRHRVDEVPHGFDAMF